MLNIVSLFYSLSIRLEKKSILLIIKVILFELLKKNANLMLSLDPSKIIS